MFKKNWQWLIILFAFLSLAPNAHAAHADILGVGDSIMFGTNGATNGPFVTDNLTAYFSSQTYANGAFPACCIANVMQVIDDQLIVFTPHKVYSNIGVNDIGFGVPGSSCDMGFCCTAVDTPNSYCAGNGAYTSSMADWLTAYSTLKSKVEAASATLYAIQLTPDSLYGGVNNNSIKIWNANLEEWCVTNSVPLAGTWQDMMDTTTDDYLMDVWTDDGLHPNAVGDVPYGYLISRASIPDRTRSWGNAGYPDIKHESWSWWIITGTGSINEGNTNTVTGKLKQGRLFLSNGANAVSPVLSIVANSNYITITLTTLQGTPVISYRTSTSNFTRAAEAEWTTYTGEFQLAAGTKFIQIKIANASATELKVSQAKLDWNVATVNGACGSADGATVGNVTSANACSAGNSSAVTLSGLAFSWSCVGTGGGTTDNCTASQTMAPTKYGASYAPIKTGASYAPVKVN